MPCLDSIFLLLLFCSHTSYSYASAASLDRHPYVSNTPPRRKQNRFEPALAISYVWWSKAAVSFISSFSIQKNHPPSSHRDGRNPNVVRIGLLKLDMMKFIKLVLLLQLFSTQTWTDERSKTRYLSKNARILLADLLSESTASVSRLLIL